MGQRLQLQANFETLLGSDKVYFQPPAGKQMAYPCIVYKRDAASTIFADNNPYRYKQRYMVTVIDNNPDSLIPGMVALLPMCIFNRHFTRNNLNHDVFVLYY
jgi:hypothetical protein